MPQLLESFRDYGTSNAIVMFARLICSCYLQQQQEMFAPFLAADGLTVSEFVHREVEPLDKEVEQIQIMALCQALDFPVKIAYLDRSPGTLNCHDILEAHPKVCILLLM
jgi:ubiquitin thioesterase protein OTUB1